MRSGTWGLAAALLAFGATAARADDLTGAKKFLCASQQATVCEVGGDCEMGAPWNWDVPEFIVVDLTAKTISTTPASGENRSTPILNLQKEDGYVVLQGYENRRAFSFLINEKSGQATVAVARTDLAVTVFGACTPKD